MSSSIPAKAESIHQLILDCGQQARQLATDGFDVFEKGKDDYVTSVDRSLDAQLAQGLAYLFPQDGIISEENFSSKQVFQNTEQRLWLVDPIDGTDDFIHRQPHYAVMVGVLRHYLPVAGWVYAPALHQLYCGGEDWGLFQINAHYSLEPLVPTAPPPHDGDVCPMMIGYTDRKRFGHAIAQQIPNVQFHGIGSFGLKVMEVIRGRVGLYLYMNQRVKLWDTTGPIALAQAAGLICCDLEGNAIAFDQSGINAETLRHRQPILVGWPSYIQNLRPLLHRAVVEVLAASSPR
jgi:3'(2'), 5'-bisphosphate nucleotidase